MDLEQGKLVGELAKGIEAANAAIADLDFRIEENKPFIRFSAYRVDGTEIRSDFALSADESTSLLRDLRVRIVARREAAQAQFDTLTTPG